MITENMLEDEALPSIQEDPMEENQEETMERKRMFDYETCKPRLEKLIDSWHEIRERAEMNRLKRNLEVDLNTARQEEDLAEDEVFIPMRVIDENIRKEQPPYVNFLRKTRRLCIFEDQENPNIDTTDLTKQFTRGLTYRGWNKEHFKNLDGGQLHGWDNVEIEFDESKPFNIAVTHVGYENIIFDKSSKCLEDNEEILRIYEVSTTKLEKLASKYSFNEKIIENILKTRREKEQPAPICIYKRFFKYDGKVFVCWFVNDSDEIATDWLRPCEQLFLGDYEEVTVMDMGQDPLYGVIIPVTKTTIVPKQEETYPIKQYFYTETEEPKIIDHKGRAFYDLPKQESQTTLWSTYINGSIRASNIFASPKNPSGSGSMPQKMDMTLENGCAYTEPMEFWNMPYPSMDLIRTAQSLDVKTASERGDFSAAVINRQDARKTAEELKQSESKEVELNSVQLSNYSDFITCVYSDVWRLVRGMGVQGLITLLPLNTGQPNVVVNDVERLKRKYIVKAAGDIDVVEKQEDLNKRIQLWPIYAQTPLAMVYLMDMTKKAFPEDADRYAVALQQAQQQQQLTQSLVQMLQAASEDPQVLVEQKPQIDNLVKQLGTA